MKLVAIYTWEMQEFFHHAELWMLYNNGLLQVSLDEVNFRQNCYISLEDVLLGPFPVHRRVWITNTGTISYLISEPIQYYISQDYNLSRFPCSHELEYYFRQVGCCPIDRCCVGGQSPSTPTTGLVTALASTQMLSTGTNKY